MQKCPDGNNDDFYCFLLGVLVLKAVKKGLLSSEDSDSESICMKDGKNLELFHSSTFNHSIKSE
jgi:hypothetical protein